MLFFKMLFLYLLRQSYSFSSSISCHDKFYWLIFEYQTILKFLGHYTLKFVYSIDPPYPYPSVLHQWNQPIKDWNTGERIVWTEHVHSFLSLFLKQYGNTYLHRICTVLDIIHTDDLKYKRMCIGYMPVLYHLRKGTWASIDSGILGGPGTNLPWIPPKDNGSIIYKCVYMCLYWFIPLIY